MKTCLAVVGIGFACLVNLHARTLEGQVFIVTKGAESIKLGLVEVAAVPAPQTIEAMRKVDEDLKDDRAKSLTAGKVTREALDRIEQMETEARDAWINGSYDDPERDRKEKLWKALSEIRGDLSTTHLQADLRNKYLYSSGPYLVILPPAVAKTKTDADGNFSLELPDNGVFAIAAKAERHVGDTVERYAWLVTTNTEGTKKLILSNDNLTSQGSPNSLIQTMEDTGAPPSPVSLAETKQQLEAARDKVLALVPATPSPTPAIVYHLPTRPVEPVLTQSVMITSPCQIAIRYGKVTLTKGTRIPLVSHDDKTVRVRYYDGETYSIPLSSTDLATKRGK